MRPRKHTDDSSRRDFLAKTGGAVGLSGVLALAGCSGDGGGNDTPADTEEPDTEAPTESGGSMGATEPFEVAMGTAPSGGLFEVVGAGFAQIWNEDDRVTATPVNTPGVVRNAELMGAEQVALGFFDSPTHLNAEKGVGQFEEAKDIATMFRLWTNPEYFIARADAGIETIEDFAGKSCAIGSNGAAINWEARQHFAQAGINGEVDERLLGFSDATSAMQSGQLDGMMAFGLLPAVTELAQTTDIVVVEFGSDYLDAFTSEQAWASMGPFPAAQADWWDEETQVIMKEIMLSAHSRVPEDQIYTLTQLTFDNLEDAKGIHPFMEAMFSLEDAAYDIDGEGTIHPGSRAYFEEQGVL